MLPFLDRLRSRLIVLVLLAVLPALGLIVHGDMRHRRMATAEAHEDALRLAKVSAAAQDRFIEGARQLLVALAQLPQVRGGDRKTCGALLSDLQARYGVYANLGVIDTDGNIFCSAKPLSGPLDVRDRGYYKRALETRAFSVSGYLVESITDKPSLTFALPVLGPAGQTESIVFAALDLQWLSQLVAGINIPSGTTITVLDRNGIILARYPDPEKWVGFDAHESPIAKTLLAGSSEGMIETTGVDGVLRLYAFTSLSGMADTGAYVYAGIPASYAYDEENRLLLQHVVGLGLVALFAILAAWFAGDYFIVGQARALSQAARKLADGDLSVRSGVVHGRGELGKLAEAFDRMAESLEQQQDFTRTLLENLAEGVIACDAEGRLTVFNRAVREWHGLDALSVPAEEWFGFHDLYDKDDKTHLSRTDLPLYRALNGERVRGVELNIAAKSRPRRRIVVSGDPLFNAAGRKIGAVIAMHDISGQRHAEELLRLNAEELQRLNAELEQRVAERTKQIETVNKELEAFSYSVSHDLRAPLRIMDGFSRLLLKRYSNVLDATGQDFLQRIRTGSQRMELLIQDLLRLSKVTRCELRGEAVDLSGMTREIIDRFHESAPDRSIEVSIEDGLAAFGDGNLIHIALENLLGNAWKFTRNRTRARIDFGKTEIDGEQVFFVRDNGAGFNKSQVHRLFGAFQRLHGENEFPGTGIGLAIVQRIIKRHGGRVWAEGDVEQGAAFYFTLPCSGEP
jgi:PAS domain S-box-containing protein